MRTPCRILFARQGGRLVGLVAVLAIGLSPCLPGCQVLSAGLPPGAAYDAAAWGDVQDDLGPKDVADAFASADLPYNTSIVGDPGLMGCADGSREGFRDIARWPRVAGCAGGFHREGLSGKRSETCLAAGDTGPNPVGLGCGAADLCAGGWHLCADGPDLAEHSPTGDCESCVRADERAFFAVAKGAAPSGACTPDPEEADDLHGCGTLGQPESAACGPMNRRMGIADCLGTNGVWSCGKALDDSVREASIVTKTDPALGGVLCCRSH